MYIGVKHGASSDLIAEFVVRCLESGVEFDGWHYLLQHDSCTHHVEAVVKLVQEEASSRPPHRHHTSSQIVEQLTSPAQEAVRTLALSLDGTQRTAMNVATQHNRRLLEIGMLYLGRYETAEAILIHESGMAYIVMAYIVMASIDMAYIVMAYIVMACMVIWS